MLRELTLGARFTLVTMLLFGGGYHLALWALGRAVCPSQAEGSVIRRSDGTAIGSRLIAQPFTRPEYFHPRPSGVEYNAASTGGTNYAPSNPDHLKAVRARLHDVMASESAASGRVPSEMVTTSGSGLDPHIPPGGAALQAARVAAARGVPVGRIQELIRQHTEAPTLGFIGRPRVNVLELNLSLDQALGPPAPGAGN